MRNTLWVVALALLVTACGQDGDATEVTAIGPPPTVQVPESTTSTGAIETTTTTAPTTTTTTTAPTTTAFQGTLIEVTVAGGEVTAPETVPVPLGDTVRLIVTSDVIDQVHVHGYDLVQDVEAGATATVEFVADVPGLFEVEFESAGTFLTNLEVAG